MSDTEQRKAEALQGAQFLKDHPEIKGFFVPRDEYIWMVQQLQTRKAINQPKV